MELTWFRGSLALILLTVGILVLGCGDREEQPQEPGSREATAADYVAWAQSAEEQGQIGMARDHYRSALDRDSNSVEARHGLALLDMQDGNYADAWALFEEIRDIDPGHFGEAIPDAVRASHHLAVELDAGGFEDDARDLYILTWELSDEAGFRHPHADELHFKLASFYWPSEASADWSRALGHLHLASQARPSWPDPYLAITEVALALGRPAESLWALNRARSLSAASLDRLDEESRLSIADLYVIRAQELFENIEIEFGGIHSGTRREDPAEYLEAAALLEADSVALEYWMARLRLSAADIRDTQILLNRALDLAQVEPGDDEDDGCEWWDTYGPAATWLRDLVSPPVPPPVTITNTLTIRQAPLVRPSAAWAPTGYRLAFATWTGAYVATATHHEVLLLERAGDYRPHGPVAWRDEDTVYVSLLRPTVEVEADDGEDKQIPGASRLVSVDLADRAPHLVRQLPEGWMTGHIAVHPYTGQIGLTLLPLPDDDGVTLHSGYMLIALAENGSELMAVHRDGTPDSLTWRPDGSALLVTDRLFAHFSPATREIALAGGEVTTWPGPGTPNPARPESVYGTMTTPWTQLRLGSPADSGSSTLVGYAPLTLDTAPEWSPDGQFVAATMRIAPSYGVPHVMFWRRDGRTAGWIPRGMGVSWSPDGSYVMWLVLDATGDYRINIGRWVGQ